MPYEIPEELILSAKIGRLVPFVGAGISKLAGGLTWDEFADKALAQLINLGAMSYADLEVIRHNKMSARMKVSLAHELGLGSIDYKEILHPNGWDDNETGKKIYGLLWKISNKFVTTNYDLWLHKNTSELSPLSLDQIKTDRIIDKKIIDARTDLRVSELSAYERETVIHLHGSVRDQSTMLLTTSDYLDAYSSVGQQGSTNEIQNFLTALFKQKDILFIGYQLDELEVLEYLNLKKRQLGIKPEKRPRHFILLPFFQNEKKLIEGVDQYFMRMDIKLIPFFRDENNYEELILLLEEMVAAKIRTSTPEALENRKLMEDLLDGI